MPTELIYDIARQDVSDVLPLVLAGLALSVALAVWWRQRRLQRPAGTQAFIAGMVGVAALAVVITVWDHHRLVGKLQAGQALVAEGEVQAYALQETAVYNTTSKRYDRSTWESFHVGGVAFVYQRSGGGAGFHNGAEPPLQISDGLRLRLHYVEDIEGDRSQRRILRLERFCAAACSAGQGPATARHSTPGSGSART
jgi:hypothetical protein